MIRTDAAHTVTLLRPDPESETGELVAVEVVIKKGRHEKRGKSDQDSLDYDAALDQLWSAGLAVDDDRLEPEPDVAPDVEDTAPAAEPAADTTPEA